MEKIIYRVNEYRTTIDMKDLERGAGLARYNGDYESELVYLHDTLLYEMDSSAYESWSYESLKDAQQQFNKLNDRNYLKLTKAWHTGRLMAEIQGYNLEEVIISVDEDDGEEEETAWNTLEETAFTGEQSDLWMNAKGNNWNVNERIVTSLSADAEERLCDAYRKEYKLDAEEEISEGDIIQYALDKNYFNLP